MHRRSGRGAAIPLARSLPPTFFCPEAHEPNDVRVRRPTLHNVALSITDSSFEIARRDAAGDAFHERAPTDVRQGRKKSAGDLQMKQGTLLRL